jgi:hypothetical protein
VEVVQNHDAREDVVVAGGGLFAQMGQVLAQFLTGFVVDAKKKTSQWRLTVSAFALDSLEGGHGLRGISSLRLRVELRQPGGEVRLPGTRSPAQDQSSVLRQQRHQSLGHTFRYQRFEGQGGDGLEHDVYGRHSSDGVSHG